LAISLLIGCSRGDAPPPDRGPVTPLDPGQTGGVTGTVRVDGPVPPGSLLHLAGDPACTALGHSEIKADDVLVSEGRVQNAFVYVARGLEGRVFERPKEAVRIDQRGFVFVPRIAAAESGQAIEFVNSDPTLHNVHIVAERSRGMNFGLATAGAGRSVHLDVAEVMVRVRCDVHPWMRAWLAVLDHPFFARTAADSGFCLAEIPAGEYTLAVWHERFGRKEISATVRAGQTTEVSFRY
jgi:plastocyanin